MGTQKRKKVSTLHKTKKKNFLVKNQITSKKSNHITQKLPPWEPNMQWAAFLYCFSLSLDLCATPELQDQLKKQKKTTIKQKQFDSLSRFSNNIFPIITIVLFI